MKNTIVKIRLSLLLLFILTMAGCKKNDDLYSNSIIGKWEWLYTTGGIADTYPLEGQTYILEFTKQGKLISSQNGSVLFESNFNIDGDILSYYCDLSKAEERYHIKFREATLNLYYLGIFNDYYKRLE